MHTNTITSAGRTQQTGPSRDAMANYVAVGTKRVQQLDQQINTLLNDTQRANNEIAALSEQVQAINGVPFPGAKKDYYTDNVNGLENLPEGAVSEAGVTVTARDGGRVFFGEDALAKLLGVDAEDLPQLPAEATTKNGDQITITEDGQVIFHSKAGFDEARADGLLPEGARARTAYKVDHAFCDTAKEELNSEITRIDSEIKGYQLAISDLSQRAQAAIEEIVNISKSNHELMMSLIRALKING